MTATRFGILPFCMTMSRGLAVIMKSVNADEKDLLRIAGPDMIDRIILNKNLGANNRRGDSMSDATQTTQLPSPEYGKLEHLSVIIAEDQT